MPIGEVYRGYIGHLRVLSGGTYSYIEPQFATHVCPHSNDRERRCVELRSSGGKHAAERLANSRRCHHRLHSQWPDPQATVNISGSSRSLITARSSHFSRFDAQSVWHCIQHDGVAIACAREAAAESRPLAREAARENSGEARQGHALQWYEQFGLSKGGDPSDLMIGSRCVGNDTHCKLSVRPAYIMSSESITISWEIVEPHVHSADFIGLYQNEYEEVLCSLPPSPGHWHRLM